MAIGSYPRVTVQGTSPSQNPQNGQGLMLLNPSTGQYEAATSSTFSGGGGGGDATSANQTTQIIEAQTSNTILGGVQTDLQNLNNNTATSLNQTTQINIATESNGFLDTITNQQLKYDGDDLAYIQKEIIANGKLTDSVTTLSVAELSNLIKEQLTNSITNERIADFFYDLGENKKMMQVLLEIKNLLTDIKSNQTSSAQKTQIVDAAGNAVQVENNKLYVVQ